MKNFLLILAVSLIFNTAFAESVCDLKTIKTARSAFKKNYDKKKYTAAVKELQKGIRGCSGFVGSNADGGEDYCWAKNDLALGLLKQGKAQECRDLLATEYDPRDACTISTSDNEKQTRVQQASETNLRLCEAAISKSENGYAEPKCNLKLPEGTLASVELPGTKDCLALIGTKYGKSYYTPDLPKEEQDPVDNGAACPAFFRVSAKENKKVMVKDEDLLGDPGSCCKFDKLKVMLKNKKTSLKIYSDDGPDQPCGGSGTARFEASGIFSFEKDTIKLIRNTTLGLH